MRMKVRLIFFTSALPPSSGRKLSRASPFGLTRFNIVVLAGIFRVYRDMRQGVYDEAELERQL